MTVPFFLVSFLWMIFYHILYGFSPDITDIFVRAEDFWRHPFALCSSWNCAAISGASFRWIYGHQMEGPAVDCRGRLNVGCEVISRASEILISQNPSEFWFSRSCSVFDAVFSWRQRLPWGIWVNAPLGNGLSSAQATQWVLGRRVRSC